MGEKGSELHREGVSVHTSSLVSLPEIWDIVPGVYFAQNDKQIHYSDPAEVLLQTLLGHPVLSRKRSNTSFVIVSVASALRSPFNLERNWSSFCSFSYTD